MNPPAPTSSNVSQLRPQDQDQDQDQGTGAGKAIDWLAERHRKGWQRAFSELLDLWLSDDVAGDDPQLDEESMTVVSINAGEWLLARGQIHARGGLREINAYLLGPDGPYLTPGQKAWIALLRARPLRLYRVTEVQPGVGMSLLDEFDDQAMPQMVQERSGSQSARPGMLMGARIMPVGDGDAAHLVLSGALYPFVRLREAPLLTRLQDKLKAAAALKLHAENLRDLLELEIASAWMAQWFEPAPLPQIVDASTGEPMLLVTDHYRVLDAAALATALATHADVTGDAAQGWHRNSVAADGLQRSLAAINPGREPDRIEVFYRTQRLADEGRVWFDALAGGAVRHLTREISDPAGAMQRASGAGSANPQAPAAAGSAAAADMPPEVMARAMEQFIRRHYANWCDEPVPLLRDLTPRQCVTTPAGLERVKGLLREYEDHERQQGTDQGRPVVSYQFLWDALGITR